MTIVRVDGAACDVADFAGIPSRKRRPATCLGCGDAVIMKLGNQLQHHAAHVAVIACVYSEAEGALHLRVKFAIAEALKSMAQAGCTLVIRWYCAERLAASCKRHGGIPVTPTFAEGWDEVEVEYTVGTRRPDIVLKRDGKPIAAIEVFATHAVDDEKRADLAALGLPWCEVSTAGYDAAPWDPSRPLEVVSGSFDGICDACEREAQLREARRELKARLDKARCDLEDAKAQWEDAKREREALKAQLQQAREQARRELEAKAQKAVLEREAQREKIYREREAEREQAERKFKGQREAHNVPISEGLRKQRELEAKHEREQREREAEEDEAERERYLRRTKIEPKARREHAQRENWRLSRLSRRDLELARQAVHLRCHDKKGGSDRDP